MKNWKMNIGITMTIIVPIIGLIASIWVLSTISKDIDGYYKQYKNAVGTKVVMSKDTLIVVDYSVIRGTLSLSDGKLISYEFYNKTKLK